MPLISQWLSCALCLRFDYFLCTVLEHLQLLGWALFRKRKGGGGMTLQNYWFLFFEQYV
jgi:hypothetical protein